jgi:DNA-binding transcriptional LysR family regulator
VKFQLRALDAFRQTLRTGSASAAARELGISQPAVSRLLARLERDVGFDLFYRDRGKLIATQEARLLGDEVDLVLGRLDQIASLAQNIGQAAVGELKIVAPPSLVEGPLAPIVAQFLAVHPQLRIAIHPRDVETSKEMVATKAVDCGFAKLPLDHAGIRVHKVITSESICVLPPRHPLGKLATIRPADLIDVPMIVLGRGRTRSATEAIFDKAGVVQRVRLETQTVGSACAFVRHGVGVAILNELMARDAARGGVLLRPFRPRVLHDYAFITASAAPMAKVTEAFLAHCRKAFAELKAATQAAPG